MVLTIEEVSNIRGFQALTQGDGRVEDKLIQNINELNGKRSLGFNKTRVEVLIGETSRDTIEEFLTIVSELKSENKTFSDAGVVILSYVRNMLQKIFRTHVTNEMIEDIAEGMLNRVSIFQSSKLAIDSLERYLTCGQVVPITETCRQFNVEVREGRIIFNEPNFRLQA